MISTGDGPRKNNTLDHVAGGARALIPCQLAGACDG